jgi:hypothetical protein
MPDLSNLTATEMLRAKERFEDMKKERQRELFKKINDPYGKLGGSLPQQGQGQVVSHKKKKTLHGKPFVWVDQDMEVNKKGQKKSADVGSERPRVGHPGEKERLCQFELPYSGLSVGVMCDV